MAIILHVEDETTVRLLYREVFEELGHQIVQAVSGEEALAMLKTNRPDIIILDLKMPGMGGRGFMARFQKLKLKIPVVISTAYPHFEDDPVSLVADAFIVKSGDLGDLVAKVHELLGRHG